MAKVVTVSVKGRTKYGVAHDTTGQILKRKGKRVIFNTRAEAEKDARATRKRVMS